MRILSINWTRRWFGGFETTNQKNSFYGKRFTLSRIIEKSGKKWVGAGVIIGSFGNKYALVRFRGPYFEVDLGDMLFAKSIFELIGRDGTLRLHIPSTKFPVHYLVYSKTLIPLTKMRNAILNSNQTTRANTDTVINSQTFCEPDLNQQISIRSMGGEAAFNDFVDRLGGWEIWNTRKEWKKKLRSRNH